jgi:hypothetical protein
MSRGGGFVVCFETWKTRNSDADAESGKLLSETVSGRLFLQSCLGPAQSCAYVMRLLAERAAIDISHGLIGILRISCGMAMAVSAMF